MNPHWILHVDDQESSRVLTRRILQRAGFHVTGAATGAEALRLVRDNPSLVLLDLDLPDISGFEVCRRIKQNEATAGIPVLHVTAALLEQQHWVSALDGGADGYLCQPLDENVLLATIRALLREREARMQLRAAKEAAESANRTKSMFLASMSHEMRTPLNAILGFAGLLEGLELPPRQREYVRALNRAGDTLLKVINDLLDTSKVEAGQLQIECIPFDLDEVLDGVLAIVRPRAGAVRLECLKSGRIPPHLTGDPNRLRQVLLNLVGNALKFTTEGSVQLRVDAAAAGPGLVSVRFAVADTGVGIPRDQLQRIFDAFAQADSSTTRRYGGTGLGLTISRQLVELMHGRLEVESEPGRGSTFSFTLEFHAPASLPSPDAAPPSLPHVPALRILLADDSPDNVFLIKAYLEGSGHILDVAADGTEAVELFKARPYDLVLMDVRMPGLDGHDATRLIRAWERQQARPATPVLALTAHALQSEEEKSLQAGCTAHLNKPIRREELLAALARHSPGRIVATAPPGLEEAARGYLQRRRESLAALRSLVQDGACGRVREIAHDIKGTGSGFGFPPLTAAARDLEDAAAGLDLARMQQALKAMERYLSVVELRSG